MKKTTIHGLPITPRHKIEALAGASFEAWATAIMDRCDNAIAVIPDVIDGTEIDNDALIHECWLDWDRCMVVWHMHEGIKRLLWMCENFNYVAIGSSGDYAVPGTDAWHARMTEIFAAVAKWEDECEGAYCRPRFHLMRAQNFADEYPFDSSDSCTVAMTHWRHRNKGKTVGEIATRIDGKIQKSAGDETSHQKKRPLLFHVEAREHDAQIWIRALRAANSNQPDLFDRRAA
jgi:hypothetical protein